MGRLARRSLAAARIDPALRDELWDFVRRFVERSRPSFEAALAGYDRVTLWRAGGRLVGLATIKTMPVTVEGRRVQAIYTGWAFLDPALRGRNLIQAEGFRCFLRARLRRPLTPAYWVFGASTYKSYLLMPRNLRVYYPRRDAAWPALERGVRDAVMAAMGDPRWDPESGVLRRFGASRYREGLVRDEPAVLSDPDVAFYAASNPGQDEGDTLLSVVPLSMENWKAVAAKAARRRRR